MSLWCCSKCNTLQGFHPNLICMKCGGGLEYARIGPDGKQCEYTITVYP